LCVAGVVVFGPLSELFQSTVEEAWGRFGDYKLQHPMRLCTETRGGGVARGGQGEICDFPLSFLVLSDF